MANKVVEYILSLKDNLSKGLLDAEKRAKHLEGALGSVNKSAARMVEGFGISFGLYKGFQLIEDGIHKFHELHEAEAQLENTLGNVGERAHMTGGEMVELAKRIEQSVPLSVTQILEMEGAVARFGITSKDTFSRIISLSSDMAAATGRDGKEIASSLALIIEKPALAVRRLRQFDVILSRQQQELLAHMVATGHAAQAQNIIFDQLTKRGYAGAAAAAAAADPLFKWNKALESVKRSLGEAATAILKKLTPAFNWMAEAMKNTIVWMKEHQRLLGLIGSIAGTLAAIILTVAAVTKIWAAATWLVNAAMMANPIIAIIAAIAALVAGVIYCYNHFGKFRAIILGIWQVLKDFTNFLLTPIKVIYYLGEAAAHIFSPKKMLANIQSAKDAIKDGAFNLAQSFAKGYNEGMKEFQELQKKDVIKNDNLIKKPVKIRSSGFDALGAKEKPISKGAGQKSVTINVKINQVVGKVENHMTTIKGNMDKMKDQVSAALMSALNDFQIISEK